FFDAMQQIESGAVGELEVDDGDVRDELGDRRPPGLHRVGDFRFVSPLLDDVRHAGAGGAVIVDDQHTFHFSPSAKVNRSQTLSCSSPADSAPPYVSAMSRAAARDRSGLPSGSE